MECNAEKALLSQWDELRRRLAWRWGVTEGEARYEALAEGTDADLIKWRARGLTEDA